MTARVDDVMAYLCARYPHKTELSKARLNKMIYLADWRSALTQNMQLTELEWTFNHYGPYLDDVFDIALRNPRFKVRDTLNAYGSPKQIIELKDANDDASDRLSSTERSILNHVIEQTKELYWSDFIRLVYSTYPIATQPRYVKLDLPRLAQTYNAEKKALTS
jgi:hypothetical protein